MYERAGQKCTICGTQRSEAGPAGKGWTAAAADAIVRPLRTGSRERTLILTQMSRIGTLIYTWLCGERVGTDALGNRYYRSRNERHKRNGRERRWVVYKGLDEASKVPPEWHAWLHHISEAPLTNLAAKARPWQKPHLPNLTGTPYAYRPKGHELRGGKRAHATGDYEPWIPE
jgi:NADH:ubiquinone oxidoreductase subunit